MPQSINSLNWTFDCSDHYYSLVLHHYYTLWSGWSSSWLIACAGIYMQTWLRRIDSTDCDPNCRYVKKFTCIIKKKQRTVIWVKTQMSNTNSNCKNKNKLTSFWSFWRGPWNGSTPFQNQLHSLQPFCRNMECIRWPWKDWLFCQIWVFTFLFSHRHVQRALVARACCCYLFCVSILNLYRFPIAYYICYFINKSWLICDGNNILSGFHRPAK